MPLPSSGIITLGDIATEFSKPANMAALYGVAAGIPGYGQISMAQFYGKNAIIGHPIISSQGGTVYGSLASLQDNNTSDGYFQASNEDNNLLIFAEETNRKFVSSFVVNRAGAGRVSISTFVAQTGEGFYGSFRSSWGTDGVYTEETVTVGAWGYCIRVPPGSVIKKIHILP